MSRFLEISNDTLFWYYLASNLAYLVMLVIALQTSARHHHLLESWRDIGPQRTQRRKCKNARLIARGIVARQYTVQRSPYRVDVATRLLHAVELLRGRLADGHDDR